MTSSQILFLMFSLGFAPQGSVFAHQLNLFDYFFLQDHIKSF